MQITLDSLNGRLGMHRGSSSNSRRLKARMVEHLIVVVVQSDTMRLKVQFSPGDFIGIRGKSGHQLSARRSLQEVDGVELADTAQAGHSNLKFLDSHGADSGFL